ncbi:ArsR family transcriptional regulator [Herbaspirillum sp.]|uniref:VpaChn25_0724 family phage protein n=1 Tax=Herbaspirillum sp. TaxID=1890675 RepID=UPI001B0840A2|nr:ArsR family transcriptional regulator [Herbaspirillum sp.]MBO9538738.1 ArsR family transcriptional regulator [Herbaspirillum sp.]
MNDYEKMQRADLRLRVLQVLASVPGYRANESMVRQQLAERYAHALSQDALRGELAWLNEQGLLAYQGADIVLASLTQRGQDCAAGLTQIPGVKRPGPDEMLMAAGIGLLRQL